MALKSKAIHYTHTDLDGKGCAVLSKIYVPGVEIKYVENDEIDDRINSFLDSIETEKYVPLPKIIVTDLSVSKETAHRIESVIMERIEESYSKLDFMLIDHHKSALHLNEYKWAHVQVSGVGGLESGTSLYFSWLSYLMEHEKVDVATDHYFRVKSFVELVRQYDTWEWSNIYDNVNAKNLNTLQSAYGRDFVSEMVSVLEIPRGRPKFEFRKEDMAVIKAFNRKSESYIRRKLSEVEVIEHKGNKVGIVMAESNASELGNAIATANEDIDYVIIINGLNSVSYRVADGKAFDVSEKAVLNGGGGHAKAAGNPLPEETRKNVLLYILEILK
jgi:uncharacterized protein